MIRTRHFFAAGGALLLMLSSPLFAGASPDDVLLENSLAKLTRADYEADLERVPPEMRSEFASSPKRLTAMLNNLLLAKTLAAEARRDGIDRDPQLERRIAQEADKVLAQARLRRIEEAAGAEFDSKREEMLVKAREAYAIDKDKYRVAEEVKASHILFDTSKSSPEEALARAKEVRTKLLAGADFATLASEISEDPTAKANGGELGWFGQGRMDPEFTKAAFALKNAGDISEPVRSRFGYHLIRLEDRRPARQLSFDEVKDRIMADLRGRYVNAQREAKIASIRNDPNMKVDQEAVDGLVNHIDPELFKRALQQQK